MRYKVRPIMERLEGRDYLSTSGGVFVPPTSVFITPLATPLDATHFHSFVAAYNASTIGGTITILYGAPSETTLFTPSKADLIIQGAPTVSVSLLPQYNLTLAASGITLAHLSIGALTIASPFGHESVRNCDLQTAAIAGNTATGNGFNRFNNNTIHGEVSVTGAINDAFTHNTMSSGIDVAADSGFIFTDNTVAFITFTGADLNITISRNVIGTGREAAAISITSDDFSGVILDNVLAANKDLVVVTPTIADGVALRVEGNNFSASQQVSQQGLFYFGLASETAIPVDFGGGSQGSLGGNNFRSYIGGTNFNDALVATQVALGSTLSALHNIFKTGVTPSNVVTSNGSIQASALSPTQTLITNLYTTQLKRMPKAADYTYWTGVYANSGQTGVVNAIERSAEALGNRVNDAYENFLGRAVDSAGFVYWVGRLQAGITLTTLQAAILGSAEFSAGHTTDLAQSLYRAILNRSASAPDVTYWNAQLATLGPAAVASAIIASPEYQSNLIAKLFTVDLHRAPGASDVAYFLGLNLDALTLEARILSSGEYLTNG